MADLVRTKARLLQERRAASRGLLQGPSSTRLAMPAAKEELWNFLTPGIGALVRAEYERNTFVRDEASKKLFGYPRLFDNLLSSQPLCFNLLGEAGAGPQPCHQGLQGALPGRGRTCAGGPIQVLTRSP